MSHVTVFAKNSPVVRLIEHCYANRPSIFVLEIETESDRITVQFENQLDATKFSKSHGLNIVKNGEEQAAWAQTILPQQYAH